MLVVTETFKPPHHVPSSSVPAPKKPVPMPSGLKVRFTTFGAGEYANDRITVAPLFQQPVPWWGTMLAEVKVLSDENPVIKGFLF